MDESVKPCDDFYDYVCGKWPAAHPLTDGMASLDQFDIRHNLVQEEIDQALLHALNSKSEPVKLLAELYSDCVETTATGTTATIEKRGVTPLIETVDKLFGDWPMLQRGKNASHALPKSWTELFVNSFTHTGRALVFDVLSFPDSTTERKFLVNVRSNFFYLKHSQLINSFFQLDSSRPVNRLCLHSPFQQERIRSQTFCRTFQCSQ